MGTARRWRRSPKDRKARLLVLAGLAAFVGGVYVVVVLGGGVLVGQTDSPNLGLSVLATAVVALGFEPVQRRLDRLASHLVHGGRLSPYDVLSRFSQAVTGAYASEELPARMAKVLADGTGAVWAEVWLVVQDRLTLAGSWPPLHAAASAHRGLHMTANALPDLAEPKAALAVAVPQAALDGAEPGDHADADTDADADADADDARGAEAGGVRSMEVRQAGELLGVLRLQEREDQPLTPVEERLFAGLAAQAGLVLHGARLQAELAAKLDELSARAEELRVSRERLVDAQDAERRRLERDIHDGAQQHLVALAVNLRLAQTLAQRSPDRAAQVLAEQGEAARQTIETLVSLSRGIYPRLLTEEGVAAALRSAAGTSPVPVEVEADGVERYPPAVEAAVYFCCLEALQNAAKHSGASRVVVTLSAQGNDLLVTVRDDGSGFDPATSPGGVGLASMRDRISSVGGTLTVESRPEGGTTVAARVPAAQIPFQRAG